MSSDDVWVPGDGNPHMKSILTSVVVVLVLGVVGFLGLLYFDRSMHESDSAKAASYLKDNCNPVLSVLNDQDQAKVFYGRSMKNCNKYTKYDGHFNITDLYANNPFGNCYLPFSNDIDIRKKPPKPPPFWKSSTSEFKDTTVFDGEVGIQLTEDVFKDYAKCSDTTVNCDSYCKIVGRKSLGDPVRALCSTKQISDCMDCSDHPCNNCPEAECLKSPAAKDIRLGGFCMCGEKLGKKPWYQRIFG